MYDAVRALARRAASFGSDALYVKCSTRVCGGLVTWSPLWSWSTSSALILSCFAAPCATERLRAVCRSDPMLSALSLESVGAKGSLVGARSTMSVVAA